MSEIWGGGGDGQGVVFGDVGWMGRRDNKLEMSLMKLIFFNYID